RGLRRLRPERARPHDRLRVLDPARTGRPGLGPAALGRGTRPRPCRVHGSDHARADRRRRRPDARDVAARGLAALALPAAGARKPTYRRLKTTGYRLG